MIWMSCDMEIDIDFFATWTQYPPKIKHTTKYTERCLANTGSKCSHTHKLNEKITTILKWYSKPSFMNLFIVQTPCLRWSIKLSKYQHMKMSNYLIMDRHTVFDLQFSGDNIQPTLRCVFNFYTQFMGDMNTNGSSCFAVWKVDTFCLQIKKELRNHVEWFAFWNSITCHFRTFMPLNELFFCIQTASGKSDYKNLELCGLWN